MQGLLWLGEERWERGEKQKSGFPWKTNRLLFQSAEREKTVWLPVCGSRWRTRQFQKLHKHIRKPPTELWGREEVRSRRPDASLNKQPESRSNNVSRSTSACAYLSNLEDHRNTRHGIEHKVQAQKVYGFSNIQKEAAILDWLTWLFKSHGWLNSL